MIHKLLSLLSQFCTFVIVFTCNTHKSFYPLLKLLEFLDTFIRPVDYAEMFVQKYLFVTHCFIQRELLPFCSYL